MGRDALDLTRPRGVGPLLATTLRLFLRRTGLFLSVTLLVVAPVTILVDGVWGGALRDGAHARPSAGAAAVSLLLTAFVIPPLVTGMHAVIVRNLGEGVVPPFGRALRDAAPRFPSSIGVVVLYALAVMIGFIALVAPGIWIAVRWYFGVQVAVLDGVPAEEALRRSSELVKGRWWPTAGALLAGAIAFGVLASALELPAEAISNGALFVSLLTIVQAISLSLTALFGTLLFFSLRARARETPALVAA